MRGIKVPAEAKDLPEFIKAIRDSGLVGLGGASFPTHIKFNPKNIDDVHTLIVNAAECEPFITSDHRLMLEDAEDLIAGCQLIMKYIGLDEGYIGIEENKPDAIEHLDKLLHKRHHQHSKHSSCRQDTRREPRRVLVYEITGKTMNAGVLPAEHRRHSCHNVTTIAFVGQYFRTGMPLASKESDGRRRCCCPRRRT